MGVGRFFDVLLSADHLHFFVGNILYFITFLSCLFLSTLVLLGEFTYQSLIGNQRVLFRMDKTFYSSSLKVALYSNPFCSSIKIYLTKFVFFLTNVSKDLIISYRDK